MQNWCVSSLKIKSRLDFLTILRKKYCKIYPIYWGLSLSKNKGDRMNKKASGLGTCLPSKDSKEDLQKLAQINNMTMKILMDSEVAGNQTLQFLTSKNLKITSLKLTRLTSCPEHPLPS
jgi:hypothetical protein